MFTLEEKLGYRFKNRALLENALQHSSYANEHRGAGMRSNERLEFLGDAVLGVVTADYLYKKHPDLPEGWPEVQKRQVSRGQPQKPSL